MGFSNHLEDIVGKTIQHVVAKTGDDYPQNQFFLVFTDGSSMEFYGSDINNERGISPSGGIDRVRDYMTCNKIVYEFPAPPTEPNPHLTWLSAISGKQGTEEQSELLTIIEGLISQQADVPENLVWLVETIVNRFNPQAIEEIKCELLDVEQQAIKSAQPLQFLRSEIMDLLDASCRYSALMELGEEQRAAISVSNEALSDEYVFAGYVSNEFKTACLRAYCLAKYGDGGSNDWFSHYIQAAEEEAKHMAGVLCVNAGVYDGDLAILATLQPHYRTIMADLRSKLINTPVGATFPVDGNDF